MERTFNMLSRPTSRLMRSSFAPILLAMWFALVGNTASADPVRSKLGQNLINSGRYIEAIHVFSSIITDEPTAVDGYRGRIEAELLLGKFSDAVRDYARVTAFVFPVHPDADGRIQAHYAARLAKKPNDIPSLTGAGFATWWFFDYPSSIDLTKKLLAVRPHDLFGNLFHGSSLLLLGINTKRGVTDLQRAIQLAPHSPDVRFIVADAYTYGLPDPDRAFAEAMHALMWGLDTPRIHAILANAYLAFDEPLQAAAEFKMHIQLVTSELVPATSMVSGDLMNLFLVPGRTYEIPIQVNAGTAINITTDSPSGDISDTIMVLLAPDGTPVVGNDDYVDFFAGIDWTATDTGTYKLRVTSFESVGTGEFTVTFN